LADVHDDWQADDRCSPSEGSMQLRHPERHTGHVAELTPGV